MSTLSQRLKRLRDSGKAPQSKTRPTGSTQQDIHNEKPSLESSPPKGSAVPQGTGPSSPRVSASRLRRFAPSVSKEKKKTDGQRPPGEGWREIAPCVWERSLEYHHVWRSPHSLRFLLPSDCSEMNLRFYDLETTGLSGGAGNIAFLIGLGWWTPQGLQVIQLFLADYPGEPQLLERYQELVDGEDAIQVSFNGKSFDSHVLQARFLLNRMVPFSRRELDLLHPSRRLWKEVLPRTDLQTLEREVLGVHRKDDLPGSEAPEAWFTWLKGEDGPLEEVFRHNAQDIVSLALLLTHLQEWGCFMPSDDGLEPQGMAPSSFGMARQWQMVDEQWMRSWLEWGWKRGERRCGQELGFFLKRQGQRQEAQQIWKEILATGLNFVAAVELAKDYEHRERNIPRAIEALEGLEMLPLSPSHRQALRYRQARLLGKLEKE